MPRITSIGVYLDPTGHVALTADRGDPMVHGSSDLGCYQPLLGYGLERLAADGMAIGPVMAVDGGRLNLKNPACYLFPKENACAPGDRFTVAQSAQAEAFTRHKPFAFARPFHQRASEVLSPAALGLLVAMLVASAAGLMRETYVRQRSA